MMSSSAHFKRAFSLVELLVVIAIISILVSLTLPSLKNARESARLIDCASRMRQVFLLAMAYREDNGQFYPACHFNKTGTTINMAFGYALRPYIPEGMNRITLYTSNPRTNLLMCPNTSYRSVSPFTVPNDVWPHVYAGNGLVNGYNAAMQFGGGNDASWTTEAQQLRYRPKREINRPTSIAFFSELSGSSPYLFYTTAGNIKYNHFEGKSVNVTMSDGVVRAFHENLNIAMARPDSDNRKLIIW
jgi:prepilin-type N-terminal cleavage/methylation domain-containing protein